MRKNRRYILDIVFLALFGLLYWKPFVFNVSTSYNVSIPLIGKGFGIDVSHHQGKILWDSILDNDKLKPSIDFVFLKATEGGDHLDTQFESNVAQLNNHDVSFGFYHFFRLNVSSIKQANFFLSKTKRYEHELPLVLDVETKMEQSRQLIDSVSVFVKHIENQTGKRPIIYCPWSYYHHNLQQAFPAHKFWVARYNGSIDLMNDKQILYWQFTDKANLPFHDSKIDLNVSSFPFN